MREGEETKYGEAEQVKWKDNINCEKGIGSWREREMNKNAERERERRKKGTARKKVEERWREKIRESQPVEFVLQMSQAT